LGVLAVWVGNCDPNLAAVGTLISNNLCQVHGLFRQKQE